MPVFVTDNVQVIPVNVTGLITPNGTPYSGLLLTITQAPIPNPGGSPWGGVLLSITQPPVTTDNPVTLIPGSFVAAAKSLSWARVMGYQLSSQQTGTVQIRSDYTVLTTLTFPGIATLPTDVNYGLAGDPKHGLYIAPQVPGLQVTGHIVARVEPIWRAFTMGSPVGLLLTITRP